MKFMENKKWFLENLIREYKRIWEKLKPEKAKEIAEKQIEFLKAHIDELDEEDLKFLLYNENPEIRKMAKEVLREKKKKSWFFSEIKFQYGRTSLFLMGWTMLLLLIGDPSFRKDILYYGFEKGFLEPLGIMMVGAAASICYTFSERLITKPEKGSLIGWAIYINLIVSIAAQNYLFQHEKGFLIIFPILNLTYAIIYFVVFLSFFNIGKIKPEIILGKPPKKKRDISWGDLRVYILFNEQVFVQKLLGDHLFHMYFLRQPLK
jgi:hypothetical protein